MLCAASTALTLASSGLSSSAAAAKASSSSDGIVDGITVPLVWNGAAYCVYYRIDGTLFRANVDSGSPFLMIPGSCAKVIRQRWGCYKRQGEPSSLEDSIEVYDGKEGLVQWRSANSFYFENATIAGDTGVDGLLPASPAVQAPLFGPPKPGSSTSTSASSTSTGANSTSASSTSTSTSTSSQHQRPGGGKGVPVAMGGRFGASDIIFGVASESLLGSPGGVFLGLVKEKDKRIRPTFLGQSRIKALEFNFAGRTPLPEGRVGGEGEKSRATVATAATAAAAAKAMPAGKASSSKTISGGDGLAGGGDDLEGLAGEFGGSSLTLSRVPLVPGKSRNGDYVPLVRDLRRFGDATQHYTAVASSVVINGVTLVGSTGGGTSDAAAAASSPDSTEDTFCGPRWSKACDRYPNPKPSSSSSSSPLLPSRPIFVGTTGADNRPIYAIIDTGVTGMVMDRNLFNKRYAVARRRRESNLWGCVVVSFRTRQRKTIELSATSPITTPIDITQTWKGFRGHLIVLGLAFLEGCSVNIDIDDEKLWIEDLRQQRPDSTSYFIPKARVFDSLNGVA